MSDLKRKAINFDLITEKLKEFYPSKNPFGYKSAYRKINKFFKANGFEHRQGSGYVSIEGLDIYDATKIAQSLSKEFPWLKDCVNKFDVTDVGYEYDLTEAIKNPDNTVDVDLKPPTNIEKTHKRESLNSLLNRATVKADEINSISKQTKLHKGNEINQDL